MARHARVLTRRFALAAPLLVIGVLGSGSAAAQFPGPDEWYVRLVVTSGAMQDPGNTLGLIVGGSDGWDPYDLEELPTIGPPYLTAVFPHPDWGPHAGDYTVDFHAAGPGRGGWWDFEVRSDVARTVTLTWELVAPAGSTVLERSLLFDLGAGGDPILPAPGGAHTFAMVGTVHAMSWWVNSRPQVWAGEDQAVTSLTVVSLPPATFTDEDPLDTHTATVDWGDGTVVPAAVNQVAGTVSASHLYQGLGQYTATVCVDDGLDDPGCDSFVVAVDCAPGDVNGDGVVDRHDLVALVGHLYGQPAPCPDVNLDGTVDAADLAQLVILVEQWQVPPPP